MMSNKTRSQKAQKFLERIPKKLKRQLVGSLVACAHCGMCTKSCHYVLANPDDPKMIPSWKADQIRKIFKRHFDWTGRVFPWWVHADTVYTDKELEELKDIAFGRCTNCRRCTFNCPMGVDFATLNRVTRGLLTYVGIMPEGVEVVSKDQWEIGNQMGILKEDYVDTLEWMEEEMQDDLDDLSASIPIDKENAAVVYSINPREVKYDPRSIQDAAKIFHAAGEDWTMPSECWDMTNFGLFSGDDELGGTVGRRLFEKVADLKGKKLVISECGHGYRSTRCEAQNWGGVDVNFEMESSVMTMINYIKKGKIKVDKNRNSIPVTFHDSCNNARSCGLYEEPRELLNLVVTDFKEMYPNRAENYCCTGGGGAMSMSEYTDRRLKSGKIKAEQLKATGAKIVVTSCHNCVDGLADVIKHYGLDMEVTQLVNLVSTALIVEKKATKPPKSDRELAFAGRKILIIDDEPDILAFYGTFFEDHGAISITTSQAEKAVSLARKEMPDLITLDLSMPGKDGSEIYAELRQDKELKNIPICIITGKPELRKLIYGKDLPKPEGYLDKPVSEDDLFSSIQKIFMLKKQHIPLGK